MVETYCPCCGMKRSDYLKDGHNKECIWHTHPAISGQSFYAHPIHATKIMGTWAEDGGEYEIIVPAQLRDIILEILQRESKM